MDPVELLPLGLVLGPSLGDGEPLGLGESLGDGDPYGLGDPLGLGLPLRLRIGAMGELELVPLIASLLPSGSGSEALDMAALARMPQVALRREDVPGAILAAEGLPQCLALTAGMWTRHLEITPRDLRFVLPNRHGWTNIEGAALMRATV